MRLKHYIKKTIQLGLWQTVKVVHNRMQSACFDYYWRTAALHKKAHHTWSDITRIYNTAEHFPAFLPYLKNKESTFLLSQLHAYSSHELREKAELITQHTFDILGIGASHLC